MNPADQQMNSGDTAWVLFSAALVLLMIPAAAFFYGGTGRKGTLVHTLKLSAGAMSVVGLLWLLFGYSMTFGTDLGLGLLGDPLHVLSLSVDIYGTVPALAFAAFQAMIAMLAVALVACAFGERIRFVPWLVFAGLWATLVYFPVAHWVFALDLTNSAGQVVSPGGWIANRLVMFDLAGGTAVHLNAGAAALAVAVVLRKRAGWAGAVTGERSDVPAVVLGAGLLWFGWFGCTAGFELGAGSGTSLVFVNTLAGACASLLGWLVVDRIRVGRATASSGASGVVAGLVALSPAAAAVSPVGALAIGALAGVVCALVVGPKPTRFRRFIGIHPVGGLIGTLLVGFFATTIAPAGAMGVFFGGGWDRLWHQAVGAGVVLGYSFGLSLALAWLVERTLRLRASSDDKLEHAETSVPSRMEADAPRVGEHFESPTEEVSPGSMETEPAYERTGV